MTEKENEFIKIQKVILVKEGTLKIPKEFKKISSPSDISEIFKKYLEGADREYMACICLNTKNDIINISTISIGSLNSAIIHPREVYKIAILSNAASIILAHNHPSENVEPSKEDVNITIRIKECGKILGIELLDHIIIGGDTYKSFKESELL